MSAEVQAIGQEAVASKYSSSLKGYFEDPFLPFFVSEKERRRPPLINRGYYARFRAFELILKRFEKEYPGDRQIVSLGGGSETIWFRLKSKGIVPKMYVEVDLEPVATSKAKKVTTTPEMNVLLTNRNENLENKEVPLYSENYRIISCDLTNSTRLSELLLGKCEINPMLPTLFLSECVLVYIDPESSGDIIAWVAKLFPFGHFLTYEQINPNDPFGEQMMSNLRRRGCELKGIQAHPDLPSQEKRFLSRGWKLVKTLDMKTFYYEILSKKDRARAEKLEIFDEFEEFFLIMQHYALTLASMNVDIRMLDLKSEGDEDELAV